MRTTIGTSRSCWRARLEQAAGHLVAARDAAEDVDEDRPDARVREDQPQRGSHLVGSRATADVEEVGRLAAGALDQVHGRHGQSRAVDHAADGAVEADEAEALRARLDVDRVLFVEVAHGFEIGVAVQRRVVDGDLGVERLERLDLVPSASVVRTMASGLISTRSASFSIMARKTPFGDRDGVLEVVASPRAKAISRAWWSSRPRCGCATALWMASGRSSASSSISMPPSAEPMRRMRLAVAVEHGREVQLPDDVGGRRDHAPAGP